MNGRSIFVLLALSLSSIGAAACSDDSTSQQSSRYRLDGTYRPIDKGAIGSVTFTNDKDYVLVPSGCGSADCTDVGTFTLDSASHTVYLENASTHRTRTIVLEDIKTADVATTLVKSFADLVDPGGEPIVQNGQETTKTGQETTKTGQETTKTGQETTKTGQQLAEKAQQLIESIVQAMMNGQGMKKDDQGGQNQQQQQQQPQQQNQQPKKNDPNDPNAQPADPNADPNAPPADPNDPNAPKP